MVILATWECLSPTPGPYLPTISMKVCCLLCLDFTLNYKRWIAGDRWTSGYILYLYSYTRNGSILWKNPCSTSRPWLFDTARQIELLYYVADFPLTALSGHFDFNWLYQVYPDHFNIALEFSQLNVWPGDWPMMTTPCEKLTCSNQWKNSVLVDNIAVYKKIVWTFLVNARVLGKSVESFYNANCHVMWWAIIVAIYCRLHANNNGGGSTRSRLPS